MKIKVVVKPNARKDSVQQLADGSYRIAVKSRAAEGKANTAVIAALADYFDCPKSQVQIASGHKSRIKFCVIPG